MLFTDHSKNDLVFPIVSYIPSLVFLSLSAAINLPAFANFVLLTLAFVLLPQTFVFIAEKVVYLNQKSKLKLWSYGTGFAQDFQGLVVLVKKSSFLPPLAKFNKPFKLQGYPASFSVLYWLQRTLFRPGFMIASLRLKSGQLISYCNSHMVIGDDNNLMRVEQAKELVQVMKKYQGL